MHVTDGRTDRQNYDSQDRAGIAALCGKNENCGTLVNIQSFYTRAKNVLPNILHASRRQCVLPSPRHPPPPGCDAMVSSAAACSTRHTPYYALSMGMTQQFFIFVPGDPDLWPWHSNSSEQRTKHVFSVNLAQIRSAVREIFEWQTNKQTKTYQRQR